MGHFSEAIQYGVVATLKDGSQLKSPNLGGQIPWSDFKLDHKGCSNTVDEVRVDEDAYESDRRCNHPQGTVSLSLNT